MCTIYLLNPDPPEQGICEPEVYTCAVCDCEFTEGKEVEFPTGKEIVCNDCFNDQDYQDLIASKKIKAIRKLN